MISQHVRIKFAGLAAIVLGVVGIAGCGTAGQTRLPAAASDPNVVAVFDDEVLTLDEFEVRYARSTGTIDSAKADSLGEYRDFLERYVNFRLKVQAARDAGMDDSPEVRGEILTYRSNLARPYLLEQEVLEPIIQEIYERRQEHIDASHILIRIGPDASPEDSLAAFKRMEALRDSALQGVDFGDLAFRHSEDPSARRDAGQPGARGRLGYFSSGRLVEPFETYAYETPAGGISPVFRTRFGYHILKVHERRPAVPEIRLSHIMIRPNPTPEDSTRVKELMQDLKQQLAQGAEFAELARQHSQDTQSSGRGGDIGMVSLDAPIHDAFKTPAFELEEVGDVSDVLLTPYGYHLIKLTDRADPKSYEESYEDLKQLATKLPRTQTAEAALARDILRQRNAQVDTALVLDTFREMPADSVFQKLIAGRLPADVLADTVLVLGDSVYTVQDMSESTKQVPISQISTAEGRALAILTSFVNRNAIDYEAARLEERDAEFKRLMDEFRDGLVLFQFMEDSVWTAAEQDSAALRAYYAAHAEEYWWPVRTRVLSLQSPSDSLLNVATGRLDAGESLMDVYTSLVEDTLNTFRLDTTLVADSTNSIYDRALALGAGEYTEALPHRGSHIVLVNDGKEAARRKTFEEARSQVVSEYQKILEERIVERLRLRYNAHTFPQRLVNAYRDDPQPTEVSSGG